MHEVTIWFSDGTVTKSDTLNMGIRDAGLTLGNVFYPWHTVQQIEKHPRTHWSSLTR